MWIFYHKIPAGVTENTNDLSVFIVVGIITAIAVLAPSFLERKRNESR